MVVAILLPRQKLANLITNISYKREFIFRCATGRSRDIIMCKQLLQEKKKVAGFILALLFTSASSNLITLEQEGYLQIINAENGALEAIFFISATGIRISGDHSSV